MVVPDAEESCVVPQWVERLVYSVEVFDAPHAHGNLIEVLARVADLEVARATLSHSRVPPRGRGSIAVLGGLRCSLGEQPGPTA